MPNKRVIATRKGGQALLEDVTVETRDRGIPRPREVRSDKNQLSGRLRHGTNKGKKISMRDKLR